MKKISVADIIYYKSNADTLIFTNLLFYLRFHIYMFFYTDQAKWARKGVGLNKKAIIWDWDWHRKSKNTT